MAKPVPVEKQIELADDLDMTPGQPDFFLGLAQGGRDRVFVILLRAGRPETRLAQRERIDAVYAALAEPAIPPAASAAAPAPTPGGVACRAAAGYRRPRRPGSGAAANLLRTVSGLISSPRYRVSPAERIRVGSMRRTMFPADALRHAKLDKAIEYRAGEPRFQPISDHEVGPRFAPRGVPRSAADGRRRR